MLGWYGDTAQAKTLGGLPNSQPTTGTATGTTIEIITSLASSCVRQVEVNLLAQPPLRADAEAVADDQHPDQQPGIIEGRRHVPLERKLVEQRVLLDWPLPIIHYPQRS